MAGLNYTITLIFTATQRLKIVANIEYTTKHVVLTTYFLFANFCVPIIYLLFVVIN